MPSAPLRQLFAVVLTAAACATQAQTLRIGLAEDPDALDPTLNVTQPTVVVPVVEDTSCPAAIP